MGIRERCGLESVCLGTEVGDRGIKTLAPAIPRSRTLQELWLGNKVGNLGVEDLCRALRGRHPLKLLGLGGRVRGGVIITNRLEDRAALSLSEMLRKQPPAGLSQLRISGHTRTGGAAWPSLLRACL